MFGWLDKEVHNFCRIKRRGSLMKIAKRNVLVLELHIFNDTPGQKCGGGGGAALTSRAAGSVSLAPTRRSGDAPG